MLDFFSYFGQTGATIQHFHYEDSEVSVARDLATLVRLVRAGRLHPELGVVAHWSQTATVLTDLRERRIRGKAVLCVPCPDPTQNEGATT
jgi:NADPH:quinone reductase